MEKIYANSENYTVINISLSNMLLGSYEHKMLLPAACQSTHVPYPDLILYLVLSPFTLFVCLNLTLNVNVKV